MTTRVENKHNAISKVAVKAFSHAELNSRCDALNRLQFSLKSTQA